MLIKISTVFSFLFFMSCQNLGQLHFITDLPKDLKEVSGTEVIKNSDVIWMINDSGNQPKLYGVSIKGKILKEIYIKAKNNDWEDLTSDNQGTIYIGDFGNNSNRRKNLSILIIENNELDEKNAEVTKIKFEYPNQHKFPPKKKNRYFDAESFFFYKGFLYVFTKSDVKNKYGKTTLYKIPAKKGTYIAEIVSEFENCSSAKCRITSADISDDGSKVALLSQEAILIFTNFKGDHFFSGNLKKIPFIHRSQKEGVTFKDNNTLYITDEYAHGNGGNLYELKID